MFFEFKFAYIICKVIKILLFPHSDLPINNKICNLVDNIGGFAYVNACKTMCHMKMIFNTVLSAAALTLFTAGAQTPREPLCIVNGQVTDAADLRDIEPADIISTEVLPADEETIAKYGEQANYGVIIISLRYDTPAMFTADTVSFSSYIARHVEWGELERVARYRVRFTVLEDGSIAVGKELESTDPRLRRKVLRAVSKAPKWQPASKDGHPVESSHVLRIQLPEGREMPPERAIILR